MKKIFLLSAILLLLVGPGFGQDQQTMNRQAAEDFAHADKKLNQVYRQLLPKLTQAEKDKLIDAELLWIKFRDANARARAESCSGGSLYPMLYSGAQKRSTETRTQELQEWLDEFKSR